MSGPAWDHQMTYRKAEIRPSRPDDEAILSSYNVTVRSRKHDHEIGVQSANAGFVKSLTDLLEDDMRRSKQLQVAEMDDIGTKVGSFIVNTLGLDY